LPPKKERERERKKDTWFPRSVAGVSLDRAPSGHPITAHHSYAFLSSERVGGGAVIQTNKQTNLTMITSNHSYALPKSHEGWRCGGFTNKQTNNHINKQVCDLLLRQLKGYLPESALVQDPTKIAVVLNLNSFKYSQKSGGGGDFITKCSTPRESLQTLARFKTDKNTINSHGLHR